MAALMEGSSSAWTSRGRPVRAMCGRARIEVGLVDGGEAVAAGVDEEGS